MAYRFKKNEAIPHAVRRVFAEEISWAVGQLTHSKKRTEAVHEARKSVKKIRGLLNLVAGPLGSLYKEQDRYFRDAGRLLSDFRDSAVVLQVFDGLASKYPEISEPVVTEIRLNLQRKERETHGEKGVSANVVALLQQAQVKVEAWPLDGLEFAALLPALTAGFRQGRKALKQLQKVQSVESQHDFRKKVKRHWYHLRLVDAYADEKTRKRVAGLRDLETCLGDEHNLLVLAERLAADVETQRDRRHLRQFMSALTEDSQALRRRSLDLGQQLHAEGADTFAERFKILPKAPVRSVRPLAKYAVA